MFDPVDVLVEHIMGRKEGNPFLHAVSKVTEEVNPVDTVVSRASRSWRRVGHSPEHIGGDEDDSQDVNIGDGGFPLH